MTCTFRNLFECIQIEIRNYVKIALGRNNELIMVDVLNKTLVFSHVGISGASHACATLHIEGFYFAIEANNICKNLL